DHDAMRPLAERQLDRVGLVLVAQRRGRAVGIEVVDLVGVRARVAQCREHAAAWPVSAGRGDVVGIRAHAEARELRVDPGIAALRVLVLLEYHHARALAEHEPVPVDVPGSARGLRIVVARGQRTGRAEAAQAEGRYRRLRTPGDHHVGIAVLDEPAGL